MANPGLTGRIRELAASGLTQRRIVAKLAEEGLQASQTTVSRALRELPSRPGHAGRPRKAQAAPAAREAGPKPKRGPGAPSAPRKAQGAAGGAAPARPDVGVGEELADFLEGEVTDLFERARRLRESPSHSETTIDSRVKVLKALADLGERVRALRPPPPPDPDSTPDVVAAAAELVAQLERLIVLAEGERAA